MLEQVLLAGTLCRHPKAVPCWSSGQLGALRQPPAAPGLVQGSWSQHCSLRALSCPTIPPGINVPRVQIAAGQGMGSAKAAGKRPQATGVTSLFPHTSHSSSLLAGAAERRGAAVYGPQRLFPVSLCCWGEEVEEAGGKVVV